MHTQDAHVGQPEPCIAGHEPCRRHETGADRPQRRLEPVPGVAVLEEEKKQRGGERASPIHARLSRSGAASTTAQTRAKYRPRSKTAVERVAALDFPDVEDIGNLERVQGSGRDHQSIPQDSSSGDRQRA